MLRPAMAALLAATVLLASAPPAQAAQVTTLRVMLNPATAPRGTLPDAAHDRLEALAGARLVMTGATRTGALELMMDGTPAGGANAAVARLRADRAVLWAEPGHEPATRLLARAKAASGPPGRKLMIRLADGVRIDDALPLLSARAGVTLRVDRVLGPVHVLTLFENTSAAELARIADALQSDPAVQYADPVGRVRALRVPDDPMFAEQWALNDPVAGINAAAAWTLGTGDASMTVAVVDTGILPHPDLAGRVLGGYDFISDSGRARDGSGRDNDARDEGDWTGDGECFPGAFGEASSWHGTFVAGLIGANGDNGIGIAGVDWNAKILPVRVLGRCGGTFDDVLAGLLWASGVQLPGVPVNTTPAKVVNLSLGGQGACAQAVQEGIDDALAQGSVVVVAAGNDAADATGFAPAGCSGVITVGALARNGDRSSYSNFGNRIDLSAPGGDFPGDANLMLSTSNDGATTPGQPTYAHEAGTSFASPLVAGTASLMLARNALLTPGRALSIMQGTARTYPAGSTCGIGACGSGALDAGLAVASTMSGTSAPPPNAVPVIEYYRADFDHYFITASAAEAAYVDTFLGGIFKRTGFFFYAYPAAFPAPPGVQPVCRFYAAGLINSHYYTANANECQFVQSRWAGTWNLETSAAFFVPVADASGTCPASTLPVYRFFDNRNDANHRYTVDLSIRRAMINRQWIPEGSGPNGVAFCSPV